MAIVDERPVEIATEHTGVLRYACAEGDVAVAWAVGNTDETRIARETYQRMRDKGYAAYRVERDKKGKITDRVLIPRSVGFPDEAGEIVMMPQSQGG